MIRRCSLWYFAMAGYIMIFAQFVAAQSEWDTGQPVTLHEEDNGKVIQLRVGAEIRVELSGTPTTGYWWYLQDLDEEFLERVKEESIELSPPGIHGGKAVGIWVLKTKKPGCTFLKLIHHRPWEQDKKASRSFSVELKIAP